MNKEQVKGRVEAAKGVVKEVAGKVLHNDKLETEGHIQKNIGKTRAGIGDAKADIKAEAKKHS